MLAIASRTEIRLKECVRRKIAGGGARLEITKMPKVTFFGGFGICVIQAGHRIAIVAVDRPIDVVS